MDNKKKYRVKVLCYTGRVPRESGVHSSGDYSTAKDAVLALGIIADRLKARYDEVYKEFEVYDKENDRWLPLDLKNL